MICPLCDRSVSSWQMLGRHLIGCHREEARIQIAGDGRIRCWCKARVKFGNFGGHLKRKGGPAAHLLEYLL